jgi:alkaline phosphatase D
MAAQRAGGVGRPLAVVGNQVPMAQTDHNADPALTEVWKDPWDGYVAERDARVVGTEFVGTSITTGGNGADMLPVGQTYLVANPHMRCCNFQRGYGRITVTPELLTNDFRVIPFINQPGAPVSTRATYVVENGKPGARVDTA